MTEEILLLGRSSRGSYSNEQMITLGVDINDSNSPERGWRRLIVGREYERAVVERFINLKDVHLQPKKSKPLSSKPRKGKCVVCHIHTVKKGKTVCTGCRKKQDSETLSIHTDLLVMCGVELLEEKVRKDGDRFVIRFVGDEDEGVRVFDLFCQAGTSVHRLSRVWHPTGDILNPPYWEIVIG